MPEVATKSKTKSKLLVSFDPDVARFLRILSADENRDVGRILQELVTERYAVRVIEARLPAAS